jgi:subtilisin family serine protease
MKESKMAISMRCCTLAFLLALASGQPGTAAPPSWRSSLENLTFVAVEKAVRAIPQPRCPDCLLRGSEALEGLPAEVLERAGARKVEYEGFLITWLPEPAARALEKVARGRGLAVGLGADREVRLPWHSFMPGDAARRHDPRVTREVPDSAVPGLFLVQFGYPVQQGWLAELETCGAEKIAYFQQNTFLVRAASREALTTCPVERYLTWIDEYRASDRASAEVLERTNENGTWLQYIHGTDLKAKEAELPGSVEVKSRYESAQDRVAYLLVQASLEDLRRIVATDPDLLSMSAQGGAGPSDERQGQIVAGLHNGSSLCAVGTAGCPHPHYRQWLSNRGLLSSSNQQTVAVMDLGYDNGQGPAGAHHPDLENPERLQDISSVSKSAYYDTAGHGTMVAGIIAGDSSVAGATQAMDAQGFYYGTGIAPGAKIYAYDMQGQFSDLRFLQTALNYSRVQPAGGDRALIANQSWNENDQAPNGAYVPVAAYTPLSQFFDMRVLDASAENAHDQDYPILAGDQPMIIVFSAGNYAYNCVTQGVHWDSVSSPALAKNVIAVGATESYRPTPEPPFACSGCFTNVNGQLIPNGRPPEVNATHIGRVASFSGRGRFFGPSSSALAYTTRIKPDLVAPGARVFSTVPYNFSGYDRETLVTGCSKYHYYPNSANTYHTYGTGTSFSAPVVSGAAALKRKWFLDRSVNPAPSLVKAALIATADSLGGSGLTGHDHRPSPRSGWGRVNLDRLTDSRSRRFINAGPGNAVATGETLVYQLKAADTNVPTYIVLVWDDEAADFVTHSQAPLKNDLALDVAGGTWKGNFFNESMNGVDDGYSYRFNIGAWAHDTINNVEAVFLPPSSFSPGQIVQVRVTGVNVTQGRLGGRQPFSIYAYNLAQP